VSRLFDHNIRARTHIGAARIVTRVLLLEEMTFSVIVPGQVSDEEKKVLAIAELKALLANTVTSHKDRLAASGP
jgi:hypothetical protein